MTNIIKQNPYFTSIMGRTVFDQIFDQFFDEPQKVIRRSTEGYPLTDIYSTEDGSQVVEMALAGFSRDDLKIEVKDNSITISCEKSSEGDGSSRRIARRSFSKSFVDYDNKLDLKSTSASFRDGLLKLSIPPVEEAKPTTITIE